MKNVMQKIRKVIVMITGDCICKWRSRKIDEIFCCNGIRRFSLFGCRICLSEDFYFAGICDTNDIEMGFGFGKCSAVCKNLIELCDRIDVGNGETELLLHIIPLTKFHHSRVEPNNRLVSIIYI